MYVIEFIFCPTSNTQGAWSPAVAYKPPLSGHINQLGGHPLSRRGAKNINSCGMVEQILSIIQFLKGTEFFY